MDYNIKIGSNRPQFVESEEKEDEVELINQNIESEYVLKTFSKQDDQSKRYERTLLRQRHGGCFLLDKKASNGCRKLKNWMKKNSLKLSHSN